MSAAPNQVPEHFSGHNEQPIDGTRGGQLDAGRPDGAEDISGLIAEMFVEMEKLETQAATIAAKKRKIIASAESIGINGQAFRYAYAMSKLDQDKRAAIDIGCAIVRKAVGIPVQDELF